MPTPDGMTKVSVVHFGLVYSDKVEPTGARLLPASALQQTSDEDYCVGVMPSIHVHYLGVQKQRPRAASAYRDSVRQKITNSGAPKEC